MLSNEEVLHLNNQLAGAKALSVYLNAEDTDPAERNAWRVRLIQMLKALDTSLSTGPAEERNAARAAAEQIEQALAAFTGLLPGRGWAAFATADRLWHAGSSQAPLPDLVRWEDGLHVAPYLRALKQSRPVTAVLADQRHARVFTYLLGELTEDTVIRADSTIDSASAGSSKRAATRSGMRGEARGDAAQRAGEVATRRMLHELLDHLSTAISEAQPLVVAGNAGTTAAILRSLPERARQGTIEVQGVPVDATPAEVKQVVDAASSDLSLRIHQELVREIIDLTRSAGRACLGRERTERALEVGAVDTLIVSRAFTRSEPSLAERLVDRAFKQSAAVKEISDAAAVELDREGGIGARLRFEV